MAPIVRVAALGPRGSFTWRAALTLHPGAEVLEAPSVRDAVEAAERGEAEAAVVPLENTAAGPVAETLVALKDTMLRVQAVLEAPIEMVLAGDPSEGPVYAHPHAAGQARELLEDHGVTAERLVPVASTGEAALRAAREGGACLCSREAAEMHRLPVRASTVTGITRFASLSWRDKPEAENPRTLVLAVLRDEPGSLYRFLEPLAKAKVNLTRLYSVPVTWDWRYLFLVELEGSRLEPGVARALREARKRSLCTTIAGTYNLITHFQLSHRFGRDSPASPSCSRSFNSLS